MFRTTCVAGMIFAAIEFGPEIGVIGVTVSGFT